LFSQQYTVAQSPCFAPVYQNNGQHGIPIIFLTTTSLRKWSQLPLGLNIIIRIILAFLDPLEQMAYV
jgi:hypothetical protein